jgi:hypothetical protein
MIWRTESVSSMSYSILFVGAQKKKKRRIL